MRRLLLLVALCALGVLVFAPAALAEHSAAHVQEQTEAAAFAEAQVASGAWTPAEACAYSGFYAQTHFEECSGATATATPTATTTATAAAADQYAPAGTTTLPATGGVSPAALALGAAALLLASGVVAGALVRWS